MQGICFEDRDCLLFMWNSISTQCVKSSFLDNQIYVTFHELPFQHLPLTLENGSSYGTVSYSGYYYAKWHLFVPNIR